MKKLSMLAIIVLALALAAPSIFAEGLAGRLAAGGGLAIYGGGGTDVLPSVNVAYGLGSNLMGELAIESLSRTYDIWGEEITVTLTGIHPDIFFFPKSEGNFLPYFGGGFSLYGVTVSSGDITVGGSVTGINAGGGANFLLTDQIAFNADARYVTMGYLGGVLRTNLGLKLFF